MAEDIRTRLNLKKFGMMISAAFSFMRPVYIIWMKFASVLGWINTRIILLLVFYLVFTPFGLMMRLFGKDPLERKTGKNKGSYWIKKEKVEWDPVSYERQF